MNIHIRAFLLTVTLGGVAAGVFGHNSLGIPSGKMYTLKVEDQFKLCKYAFQKDHGLQDSQEGLVKVQDWMDDTDGKKREKNQKEGMVYDDVHVNVTSWDCFMDGCEENNYCGRGTCDEGGNEGLKTHNNDGLSKCYDKNGLRDSCEQLGGC